MTLATSFYFVDLNLVFQIVTLVLGKPGHLATFHLAPAGLANKTGQGLEKL